MKNFFLQAVRPLRRFIASLEIKRKARYATRRVVIGASGKYQTGWIATDIQNLNLLNEHDFDRYFKVNSIDAILAEHVFEHLTSSEGKTAAEYCWKYLKPGGYLRLAVPDGNFPDQRYIDYVKPLGNGPGSDDHKILYTIRTLSAVLSSAGFHVRPLEYWDEQGRFQYVPWKIEDGLIRRSRWHDARNTEQEIKYTSLIVDAVKE